MSGPITLFDKSFLQTLSIDESVWFDHFFLTNICPLFFVETLADLEKTIRSGRSPEQEVGLIAARFPEMHGAPNTHHVTLAVANLRGYDVPMTGQIPLAGGRPVKTEQRSGVVFDQSPEAEAFTRWQKGEFLTVERTFAKVWRDGLKPLDLETIATTLRSVGLDGRSCKSLEEAKNIADQVVNGRDKPFDRMKMAIELLNVPPHLHRPIIERWSIAGYPPLSEYAPFAAHVLQVEVFFQVALAAHLISTNRNSNKVDIAYLYYLPFSMVFVSFDKLHRKCAPLFMRKDQEFVWGADLKNDMKKVNEYYSLLPEDVLSGGIMSFACGPPTSDEFLVTRIWDKHLPRWRGIYTPGLKPPFKNQKLTSELNAFSKAPALSPEQVDFDLANPEGIALQRFMSKRKGKWWQLPKDLQPDE